MTQNPENPYGQQPDSSPYAQPAPYGQQPAPYGAPAVDPGKTMAIIAVILPFVGFSLVGLILGIIAKSKSKKAGYKNTLALVAIIISSIAIVISIIVAVFLIMYFADVAAQAQACVDGAETVTINGQIIECSSVNY